MRLFEDSRIPALTDAVKGLTDDLTALGRRLDTLETAPGVLRNEWEDVLDRMNRVMGRLNKRDKRAEEPPEEGVTTPQPTGRYELLRQRRRFG